MQRQMRSVGTQWERKREANPKVAPGCRHPTQRSSPPPGTGLSAAHSQVEIKRLNTQKHATNALNGLKTGKAATASS